MKHLNIFHSDDGHVALSIDDFVDMRQCQTNLLRQVNELCREKAALQRETELLRAIGESEANHFSKSLVGWQNAAAFQPDKPGEYLCVVGAPKSWTEVCTYDPEYLYAWRGVGGEADVTHWMPLPKLPLTMEERIDIIKNT